MRPNEARNAPSTRVLDRTWYSFGESHGDGGRVFEAPDCHFYIDDAIAWLRRERDLGCVLVLGTIEYSARGTFSVAKDAALEERYEDMRRVLALWPDLVLVELTEDTGEQSEASAQ